MILGLTIGNINKIYSLRCKKHTESKNPYILCTLDETTFNLL